MALDLRLRPLRLDDEAVGAAAHRAMAEEGFTFLLNWDPRQPWSQYVDAHRRWRHGIDLAEGMVPAAFLVAEVAGEVVGRSSIRFALNEYLASVGGHIGYGVIDGHRGRGYATEMLRQSLVIARAEGIERVLVTCDDDNIGSAIAIERNGGVLEAVIADPYGGAAKRRYWIA